MSQNLLRLIVILFIWGLLITSGQTQSISASVQRSVTFEEANRMFEEGDYEAAADNYEQLIVNGPVTADLLFNAANALWKADQRGRAVWRLRQAKALNPSDPDILFNLNLARTELGRPPVQGDLLGALEKYSNRLSPGTWAVLSLVVSWGVVAWLIWKSLRSSLNSAGTGLAVVPGVVFIFLFMGASHLAWTSRGQVNDVVVIGEDIAVRFGPLPESKVSARAPAGAEAFALDRKNDWIQIELEGGEKGWTRIQNLGFVFPNSPMSNGVQ